MRHGRSSALRRLSWGLLPPDSVGRRSRSARASWRRRRGWGWRRCSPAAAAGITAAAGSCFRCRLATRDHSARSNLCARHLVLVRSRAGWALRRYWRGGSGREGRRARGGWRPRQPAIRNVLLPWLARMEMVDERHQRPLDRVRVVAVATPSPSPCLSRRSCSSKRSRHRRRLRGRRAK